jgi:hypothetical protein
MRLQSLIMESLFHRNIIKLKRHLSNLKVGVIVAREKSGEILQYISNSMVEIEIHMGIRN